MSLLERDEALRSLEQWSAEARAGHGRLALISGEAGMGKTSLVLHALGTLPKHAYTTAYVDLWPSDGAFSFVAVTAKAIAESMGGTAEQVLKTAKEFFGQLTPSVTLDEEGKPKVTFGVSRTSSASPELEQVLAAPAEIAARGKKKELRYRGNRVRFILFQQHAANFFGKPSSAGLTQMQHFFALGAQPLRQKLRLRRLPAAVYAFECD